jgi:putative hydrolase of the HAD superfamily
MTGAEDKNTFVGTLRACIEALKQLRSMDLKIGIVTNGLESDYREVLQKVDLLDSFAVLVGVDTVGKMKPHKEIFLYALNKLKVSPSETLFVGDRLKEDYEGSRRAGLRPLLIDRDNLMSSDVDRVRSLIEVKNYLI